MMPTTGPSPSKSDGSGQSSGSARPTWAAFENVAGGDEEEHASSLQEGARAYFAAIAESDADIGIEAGPSVVAVEAVEEPSGGDAPGGADVAGVTAELASADVGEAVVRVGSGDTTSVSAGDPVAEEMVPAEPAGQATAVESIVESAAVAAAPSVESGSGRTTRATARATVGQIAGLSGDAAAVKYITAEFAIQRPKALVSGPLSVVVALPRLMPWCVGRPNHAASGSTCSPRREPC